MPLDALGGSLADDDLVWSQPCSANSFATRLALDDAWIGDDGVGTSLAATVIQPRFGHGALTNC